MQATFITCLGDATFCLTSCPVLLMASDVYSWRTYGGRVSGLLKALLWLGPKAMKCQQGPAWPGTRYLSPLISCYSPLSSVSSLLYRTTGTTLPRGLFMCFPLCLECSSNSHLQCLLFHPSLSVLYPNVPPVSGGLLWWLNLKLQPSYPPTDTF